MKMHQRLLHLYPDYKDGDWSLVDRGSGQEIETWNRLEDQPTTEEINAVSEAQADAAIDDATSQVRAVAEILVALIDDPKYKDLPYVAAHLARGGPPG